MALPGITKPPGRPLPTASGYSDRPVPPPPPPRDEGGNDPAQYGLTQSEVDDATNQFNEADAVWSFCFFFSPPSHHFPQDGSGELSKDEIQALMLNIMRGKMGEENIKRLTNLRFQAADTDRSGKISMHEFLNMYGFIKKECENRRRMGKAWREENKMKTKTKQKKDLHMLQKKKNSFGFLNVLCKERVCE